MRLHNLVRSIALLAQICFTAFSAERQQGSASPLSSTQDQTNLIAGVWDEDRNMTRIELEADGNYQWYVPYTQSDLAAKTMIQSGTWFIQNRTLTFHIGKVFMGDGSIPPGTEFHYDLKSVSPEKVLIFSPLENREITWTRVSQQDEPFWKRYVSYKPPFEMRSYLYPTNAARSGGDWELTASGVQSGTNTGAKVIFHLSTVPEFIQPANPGKPLASIADLKCFFDSLKKSAPLGSNVLVSITKIDDREALMCNYTTTQNGVGGPEWESDVCFFWQTNTVWQKSTLCSIRLCAQTKETLEALKDSLKSVKFLPAKDKN